MVKMLHKWLVLWIIRMLIAAILFNVAVAEEVSSDASLYSDCIYYFYGRNSEEAVSIEAFMDQLMEVHPELTVKKAEVYYNSEHYAEMQSFYQAYGIPETSQGVPVVFTSTGYFIGEKPIREMLENHLVENNNSACPAAESRFVAGIVGKSSPCSILESLTPVRVIGGAINNYFSPGFLGVVGILLSIMAVVGISGKSRKVVLQRALTFTFGILIAYLVFGSGFFSWFGIEAVSYYASKTIGIIMMILSLLLLRHAFSGKELFQGMAHHKHVEYNQKLDKLFSGLGTMIIGIVVGLFSFAGAHKVYAEWLSYLLGQQFNITVFAVLVFYVLLTIALMVALSWLVYWIRESGEESGVKGQWLWKKKQVKVLNIVLCVITIILGVVMVVGY
ncbi:hypothetical protein HZC30_01520 [Candidatus Woesearchaeota archaeon]|nr:hypothetical protein [Candidatus Woesearchaeota archaeon]